MGVLLALILLFVGFVVVLRLVMKAAFRGITKVGSAASYHGVRAVAGDEFARRHERAIRGAGSMLGVVGGLAIGSEIADFGGDADWSSDDPLAASDSSASLAPFGVGEGVDLDHDNVLEGYDSDGDGVLDTNVAGVPVSGLENVSSYTRSDGVVVDGYTRTTADASVANNLRPLG